jgi:hypothetical protein
LDSHDQNLISSWQEKRGTILRDRLQKEVEAELECDEGLARDSTPFLRVLVQSFDFSSASAIQSSQTKSEVALLTFWKPTNEQMSHLQEGTAFMIRNLQVRDHTFDGLIQFTANSKTTISKSVQCPERMPCNIQRRFFSGFHLSIISREMAKANSSVASISSDVDTVLALIHVRRSDSRALKGAVVYGSDETGLLIRIHFDAEFHGMNSLDCKSFPVIAFNDLKVLCYDEEENCAVAKFCDTSSVFTGSSERVDQVKTWATKTPAIHALEQLGKHLSSQLPLDQLGSVTKALGYVIGIKVCCPDKLRIEVDCKRSTICEWEFPASLLPLLRKFSTGNPVTLSEERQELCSKLGNLSTALFIPNLLIEFHLERKDLSSCEFSVVHLRRVDHYLQVAPLYLSSLRGNQ